MHSHLKVTLAMTDSNLANGMAACPAMAWSAGPTLGFHKFYIWFITWQLATRSLCQMPKYGTSPFHVLLYSTSYIMALCHGHNSFPILPFSQFVTYNVMIYWDYWPLSQDKLLVDTDKHLQLLSYITMKFVQILWTWIIFFQILADFFNISKQFNLNSTFSMVDNITWI